MKTCDTLAAATATKRVEGGEGVREEEKDEGGSEFRTDRYDLIFLPFRLDKPARKPCSNVQN